MVNYLLQVVSILLAQDDFVKFPISGLMAECVLQSSQKSFPKTAIRNEMHMRIHLVLVIVPRDNQLMFARGTFAQKQNFVVHNQPSCRFHVKAQCFKSFQVKFLPL